MNNLQQEEFDRACDKINSVKWDLMELESRLEEAGLTRKAKSLGTLIGKLEAWEVTR